MNDCTEYLPSAASCCSGRQLKFQNKKKVYLMFSGVV